MEPCLQNLLMINDDDVDTLVSNGTSRIFVHVLATNKSYPINKTKIGDHRFSIGPSSSNWRMATSVSLIDVSTFKYCFMIANWQSSPMSRNAIGKWNEDDKTTLRGFDRVRHNPLSWSSFNSTGKKWRSYHLFQWEDSI